MAAQREYESPRTVDLEFFGVSEDEVRSELREIFEAFGYDAPEEAEYLEAAE